MSLKTRPSYSLVLSSGSTQKPSCTGHSESTIPNNMKSGSDLEISVTVMHDLHCLVSFYFWYPCDILISKSEELDTEIETFGLLF